MADRGQKLGGYNPPPPIAMAVVWLVYIRPVMEGVVSARKDQVQI